jgi:hypothetical protein
VFPGDPFPTPSPTEWLMTVLRDPSMRDHAETADRTHPVKPAPPLPTAKATAAVGMPAEALDLVQQHDSDEERAPAPRFTAPQRRQVILGLQRTNGNHAVQRLIGLSSRPATVDTAPPPAIRRQSQPGPPAGSGTHTITDPHAAIRDGPEDFKPTGKDLPVGARVDVVASQTSTAKGVKGTFVQVAEHGTGAQLGWTSQANLGDVQYATAAASFVYIAKVKPREGHPDTLPVMVYVPPKFDGKKADLVIYLHGDAADFSASTANNYDRENPAIGMQLAAVSGSPNQIVIAPQINEYTPGGAGVATRSPWHTLHAGDYESIVQTVLTNLQDDLHFSAAITRGAISIAGHSGGGKGLGQAAQDLDATGDGVTDVTLVEAGYGGGEDAQGTADGKFAQSFQMVRDWLLAGKTGKVLRVITKASTPGSDTRHAIENVKGEGGRIPVFGIDGVNRAIKAKGKEADLQATVTEVATDTRTRTGGMRLIRTIVVRRKNGDVQGTIDVFLMTDPPRAKGVDTHFGVRDATIGDIVGGKGKADDFAVH